MNLTADDVDNVVDRGEVIAFSWSRIRALQRLETSEMTNTRFNRSSNSEDRVKSPAGITPEEEHFLTGTISPMR